MTENNGFQTELKDELKAEREELIKMPLLPFGTPGFLGSGYSRHIVGITKNLSIKRLYSAYMQGIFPWFEEDEGEPVIWYSPSPRFCLPLEELHVPSSLKKFLKHTPYTYTMDRDFSAVINGCRNMNRKGQNGTWIGRMIIEAYTKFHELGFAHSVEVWHEGKLAGGLYGVLIGSVFCGESMFTIESNSAKSAFVIFAKAFERCGGKLIDSQVYTENIARYGAKNISREAFLRLESNYLKTELTKNIHDGFNEILEELKI